MSDDLISRQAAIDAIVNTVSEVGLHDNSEVARYGATFRQHEIIDIIEGLPTAPRWIPVTEHLPKIDMSYPHHEDYLVQYESGGMDVASWSNVNRFWTDHVTEPYWNCVQFAKVIAWMPLPEPWKEGEAD